MRRLVIGVGNPMRGDDAAGPEVARRVTSVETRVSTTGSFELIGFWEEADEVIIVDAARSGSRPGTIHRFDAGERPLPAGTLATSTHAVGIPEVVEMARTRGRLPGRLWVYGIEVSGLGDGDELTPPVEEAVASLVAEIDHA
ncbi:MAG: hydrogenase maturation protease [Actinomycetota bacterium]